MEKSPEQPKQPTSSKTKRIVGALTATAVLGTGAAVMLSRQGDRPFKADSTYYTPNYEPTPGGSEVPEGGLPPVGIAIYKDGSIELGGSHKNPANVAQEALQVMNSDAAPNQVWNGAIVIPEGTVINRAPVNEKVTGSVTVEADNIALLERPRLYLSEGSLWAVVSNNRKGGPEGQATNIQTTGWINITEAQTRPGFETYVFEDSNPDNTAGVPRNIHVGLDGHNNLTTAGKDGGIPSSRLATVSQMHESVFTDQLHALGLIPSELPPQLDPQIK